MPLTRYPNGLTVCTTTALVYNVACTDSVGGIDCNNMYVAGTTSIATMLVTNATVTNATITSATIAGGKVTASQGSIYGHRSNLVADGSMTITLSSAVYVTGALMAPFTGYPEIVLLTGATASITRSIRLVGGTDSTGTQAVTLTLGSGTALANTVYTTIGAILVNQGSQFVITSAVTATVNTAFCCVNWIAASA